ncbi:hypothetical protein PORCRE_996 [Porphyromonas crevioricanis JCM 15906]|uniref:Uncharacterized protein n=1 Tax=Porphyromonas crevioricanis JCM 15906 TaxID=1305617 RepID=T1CHE3_9PORP|nr:hypothetical protein PORCRE_996 [Porphyromonas crevioricanis JCM 15906]GAD06626.1 hypothetical protein PORCAN_224 [Porphyromonas crevioricanis JCM 13913]
MLSQERIFALSRVSKKWLLSESKKRGKIQAKMPPIKSEKHLKMIT